MWTALQAGAMSSSQCPATAGSLAAPSCRCRCRTWHAGVDRSHGTCATPARFRSFDRRAYEGQSCSDLQSGHSLAAETACQQCSGWAAEARLLTHFLAHFTSRLLRLRLLPPLLDRQRLPLLRLNAFQKDVQQVLSILLLPPLRWHWNTLNACIDSMGRLHSPSSGQHAANPAIPLGCRDVTQSALAGL